MNKVNLVEAFAPNLEWPEQRDLLVKILRDSDWYVDYVGNEYLDLREVIESLIRADTGREFDSAWWELLDLAEYDQVTIQTR